MYYTWYLLLLPACYKNRFASWLVFPNQTRTITNCSLIKNKFSWHYLRGSTIKHPPIRYFGLESQQKEHISHKYVGKLSDLDIFCFYLAFLSITLSSYLYKSSVNFPSFMSTEMPLYCSCTVMKKSAKIG